MIVWAASFREVPNHKSDETDPLRSPASSPAWLLIRFSSYGWQSPVRLVRHHHHLSQLSYPHVQYNSYRSSHLATHESLKSRGTVGVPDFITTILLKRTPLQNQVAGKQHPHSWRKRISGRSGNGNGTLSGRRPSQSRFRKPFADLVPSGLLEFAD